MSPYAIRHVGPGVALPPHANEADYLDFSSWFDRKDPVEEFVKAQRKLGHKKGSRVAVGLVRRADNDYNPYAIAVVRPASTGGDVVERHLGYLYDKDLRKIGMANLPDLIEFAGGEVICTAVIDYDNNLLLALPGHRTLADAIHSFLKERGLDAAGAPKERGTVPRRALHTKPDDRTARTLRNLESFPSAPVPIIGGVDVRSSPTGRFGDRELRIYDTETGRSLGQVVSGVLHLQDEHDREAVLGYLKGEDVPVTPPVAAPSVEHDGSWPADAVPNGFTFPRADRVEFRARDPKDPNSREWFAIYNPATRVLWVEDSRLTSVALQLSSRAGLTVAHVGTPQRPWGLEQEISWSQLTDRSAVNDRQPGPDRWAKTKLLAHLRTEIPRGLLTDVVNWKGTADPAAADPANEDFALQERFVHGRRSLFPVHELRQACGPCRLCGRKATEFTTPLTDEVLAYCFNCLDAAQNGLKGVYKERSVVAVREIAAAEYDNDVFLESQLDSLHLNPEVKVPPPLLDKLLLLRFAIPRGAYPWTHLLLEAGLGQGGIRTSRGVIIKSRDQHLCLSLGEKAVCDFLHLHGIAHDREPKYPADELYNLSGLRRADWQLPDGTLVELWGMPNDPAYAAKMAEKRALAANRGIRLVEILPNDLPRLPEVFKDWLPAGVRSNWSWSPLATPLAEDDQGSAPALPTDPGRNAYNDGARAERLERCEQAVALQREGHTRAEIASELGVSLENVKKLLRDGKFYADPSTDPKRHDVARNAAAAREAGTSKGAFQRANQLTGSAADEAWKDAGVLFDTPPG